MRSYDVGNLVLQVLEGARNLSCWMEYIQDLPSAVIEVARDEIISEETNKPLLPASLQVGRSPPPLSSLSLPPSRSSTVNPSRPVFDTASLLGHRHLQLGKASLRGRGLRAKRQNEKKNGDVSFMCVLCSEVEEATKGAKMKDGWFDEDGWRREDDGQD